ncbi:MAG TPA: carboxypeptidase regulatory-like domain-containing protein, partial [Gemmatimonadales bacterium]|nr:carboxypeptidase regulatory-like domain-containing protein [Gemmatimonadales bacterium]
MKESSVSAFVRLARWIACAAVALTLGAGTLLAQATGKIEGRVRDQAGAPIASAQVRINGTAFGAVANAQGYYFINNVPSGVYELVGTFVGYKPVGVAGLRVAAGQTITQDFTLEQTPIEITEITVVGAQNALVPRDQVTTKQTLQGDYVEKLPVDKIQDVLALQPGVVASSGARTITIRGGRTDEAVTYIDGVPVTPGNRGSGFVGMDAGTIAVSPGGF